MSKIKVKSEFFVIFENLEQNLNFPNIWPKSKFFSKIWLKSKFFENFDQIEIFENLSKIEIFQKFDLNRNFWLKKKFPKIYTKMENILKIWLKSKFFENFWPKWIFFWKIWLQSKFIENFDQNRNFWLK